MLSPRRVWLFEQHRPGGKAWDCLCGEDFFTVESDDPAASVAEELRRRGEPGDFEIVGASGALLARVSIHQRERAS